MYTEHWWFTEKPFENAPDPKFLFLSAQHEEALMRMLYALRAEKGAALLTGDYGCGKTMLMRALISEISPEKYEVALLTNPRWSPEELLMEIIYQLGIDTDSKSKIEILHRFNDRLLDTVKAGKYTILIVDEAQVIEDVMTFEELRLLLNFQLHDRFLLTLMIVGQPELKQKIQSIPQLDQRIAIRYHLGPLDYEETKKYIAYRMTVAGRREPVWDESALKQIYHYSGGTPRKINNICDLSLVIGFGKRLLSIDGDLIMKLIQSEQGG